MSSRDIVRIALLAAIIAILGIIPPIAVPFIPVPITAQTLGVMLAGGILGAGRGTLSVVLFMLIVSVGMPLLSGGRGGLGVYVGPTAGFFIAWPFATLTIGFMISAFWQRLNIYNAFFSFVVGGIGVIYLIGVPGISIVTGIPLGAAAISTLAFLPGDLLKAAMATAILLQMRKYYPDLR